jgi:helix-turn-helix protein
VSTATADRSKFVAAIDEALTSASAPELITLLGDLEQLKARCWHRLVTVAEVPAQNPTPLEDLQHLTPARVGELLNLTEPYVHELCRTGQLAARKQGKYWIIPVRALREWAAAPKGVDTSPVTPVRSADTPRGSDRFPRRRRRE